MPAAAQRRYVGLRTMSRRTRSSVARVLAEQIVSTEPEQVCLSALRHATGAAESPMERHCLRVFLIIERLASQRGIAIDREVVLCASLLFEIGAYAIASTHRVYTADGRRFAETLLQRFAWPDERLRVCLDAIELHHQLRPQWSRGAEVELLRRAVLIDAFPFVLRDGLSRAWLAQLFRQLPRRGLYLEILRGLCRMLRERPATIPGIFLPPPRRVTATRGSEP